MNHPGIQVTAGSYGKHARSTLDHLHDENSPSNDLDGLPETPWYGDDGDSGSEE